MRDKLRIVVQQERDGQWIDVGMATTWRGAETIARREKALANPTRAISDGKNYEWSNIGFIVPNTDGTVEVAVDEPTTVNGFAWRAITHSDAEYVGNAAAYSGGYVALDGPRVAVVSHYSLFEKIYEEGMQEVERLWDNLRTNEAIDRQHKLSEYMEDVGRLWHRLWGGAGAAVLNLVENRDWGQYYDAYYVMAVPPASGLAQMGYELPEALVLQLFPELEKNGYETARKG